MKNKFLLSMMLLCFACFGVTRADVVQIGEGIASDQNSVPIKTDWNYSLTQQIFTAEEIGIGGTINSISFHYANSNAFSIPGIQVYMKNTQKDEFYSVTDMVPVSANDKVFEGTFSASGAGWVTINLDIPFVYDGKTNLLICIYCPRNGNLGPSVNMFYYTSTQYPTSIEYYDDYYVPDITDVTSYDGGTALDNFRADIQINITPAEPIPYSYDFEDAEPFGNWNVLAGAAIATSSSNSHGGTHYLKFSGNYSNLVALPKFAGHTNNLRLEFWTRPESYSYSSCGTFSVGYMTDINDATSFVAVETYSYDDWTSSTYKKKIVVFDDAPEDSFIAFRHNANATNYYWYVDDVTVKNIPPCPVPTDVTIQATTVQGFTASFTPGDASQTFWPIYWNTDLLDPDPGQYNFGFVHETTFTEGAPWMISGVTYYLWVGVVCEDGGYYWSDPVPFTLPPAPAPVPFLEEFNNTSIPENWAIYTGLLSDVMNGAALTTTTGGWSFNESNGIFDNHARINIWSTITKYWLVSPQVSIPSNCQLSFELALTKYSGTMQPVDPTLQPDDRFVVLASTDDGNTWTILREWNNTGSTYVYNNILPYGEDAIIDLTAYQGTDLRIAFYGESTVGSNGDNNLHIDNVSIDYIPACQKPSNFHVSSIADRSVVLSWDAPEGQTLWEVGYKTDDDPYYQWFTEPTENPYLFSGHVNRPLQPETHYTVKVHALCNGVSGPWSKEIEFTTLEPCPAPTNLHITQVTPYGVSADFEPGSPTQTLFIFNFTTTSNPPTYVNGTTFYHSIYYPDSWHMFEPETHYYLWVGIECEEDGDSTYVWGEPAEFTTPEACPVPTDLTITNVTPYGVTATFTPGGDWEIVTEFNFTTTNEPPTYANGSTYGNTIYYPDEWHMFEPNTHYYLWAGFRCEEGGTTTFVWGEPAEFTTLYACSTKVYAQDIEIDDVQSHEVSLYWGDSPATADQWQVYYSYYDILPSNEEFLNQVAITTDEPYVTIDSLFSNLDYYFWIRALCDVWNGTPEWGEWSDMFNVHTEASCFPPIDVTVSDITSTTATISWDPNPSTMVPVEYYEVNIESEDWGDPYVAIVYEPYFELDLEDWVEGGEDIPCTVYVHAYCGQEEGMSEASETVGFMLTDKDLLTVNDGNNLSNQVPIYGYWCDMYTKSQFIIPADDIEDMQYSEISWMTFYSSDDYINWGNAKFEVYMMELPCETEFASTSLYDWEDMDLVRSEGSLYIRDGLMVVDLEEPFYYTDGNLLIGFKQVVSGSYKSCSWYGVNQTGNTALGGYENSKNIEFKNFLPKITFVYEATMGMVCRKPKNFTARIINATTVECSWTPYSDGQPRCEIAWGGEDFDPNDRTTWISHAISPYNPCWIASFEPETTYYFAAHTVCEQNQGFYSNWTCPISLTMPEVCPKPTDVEVYDITPTSATISWENGEGNNTWILYWKVDNSTTFLSEDFESGSLPTGWTIEGENQSAYTWRVGSGDYHTTTGSHGGSYNALITHNNSNEETYLVTPSISMNPSNYLYAGLNFWFINRNWSGDIDEFGVYYRADGGEWHELYATTEAHETWTEVNIPFKGLDDEEIHDYQIGFKFTDHYGYGVGIDDITLLGDIINTDYYSGFWTTTNSLTLQSFLNGELFEPNTTYRFKMKTSCDAETEEDDYLYSNWTDVFTFETPPYTFITDGSWNDDNNWNSGTVAPQYSDVVIAADAVIPDGYIAYAAQITLDGGSITIAEGGQLRSGSNVEVTVEKNITGYGSGNGKYYLISNPLWVDVYAANVEDLIPFNATDYDLYEFEPEGQNNGADDEYAYREWRNYKADPFLLYTGQGYLYANKEDVTLRFTGEALYTSHYGIFWEQGYDENTEAPFGNWFLTGNFFTCNSYLVYADDSQQLLETNFYVMNEAGTDLQLSETQASLGLCEGAFIEKPSEGRLLYMTYNPRFVKSGILNITLTQGEGEIDQARIRFGEGHNLGKLSLREKSSISIPKDGKDFAVVYTENRGEMPVSFKALTDGTFTMSFSSEEVNFSYLHLIDNLTGEDIDLLDTSTGSVSDYTFEARTTDKADRFKVVFVTAE